MDVGAARCTVMKAIEVKGTKENADEEEWDIYGPADENFVPTSAAKALLKPKVSMPKPQAAPTAAPTPPLAPPTAPTPQVALPSAPTPQVAPPSVPEPPIAPPSAPELPLAPPSAPTPQSTAPSAPTPQVAPPLSDGDTSHTPYKGHC